MRWPCLLHPLVLAAALPVVGLGLIFNAAHGIVLHAQGVAVFVVTAPIAALGFCQPVQVVVLVVVLRGTAHQVAGGNWRHVLQAQDVIDLVVLVVVVHHGPAYAARPLAVLAARPGPMFFSLRGPAFCGQARIRSWSCAGARSPLP